MSGQPNRYANSAEMFKNQYMDALNLRANVDDFNLQANKNYKKTGTLPPNAKQMVDNRTTTEILADTEKLKLNIISELKPVMNSSTSSVVVQKIQTSPLNSDGSFLVWLAQNINEIVKSLKKKYVIGIKGDSQDAQNIVIFLSDMYSKIKDYTGTVKSYFDTVGESKTGLKEGDLNSLRKEYDVIIARIRSIYPNFKDSKGSMVKRGSIRDLIFTTTNKIKSLDDLISSDKYKQVIDKINGPLQQTDFDIVNGLNTISKAIFKFYDNLPSVSQVRILYRQLEKSLDNSNQDLSIKILNEIYDIFGSDELISNVRELINSEGNDIIRHETDRAYYEKPKSDAEIEKSKKELMKQYKKLSQKLKDADIISLMKKHQTELKINEDNLTRELLLRQYDELDSEIIKNANEIESMNDRKIPYDSDRKEILINEIENLNRLKELLQDFVTAQFDSPIEVRNFRYQSSTDSYQSGPSSVSGQSDYTGRPDYINPFEEINDLEDEIHAIEQRIYQLTQLRKETGDTNLIGEINYFKNKLKINKERLKDLEAYTNSNPYKKSTDINLLEDKIDDIEEELEDLLNIPINERSDAVDKKIVNLQTELQQLLIYEQQQNVPYEQQQNVPVSVPVDLGNTNKVKGDGFKKRRGRPKGSGISFKDNIDHAKGIQPAKKYHPFGKYFVNSHKLNNGNVLSIKSKSGTNIREYPSRTVSQHLGNVIKTIVGGGVPSYNDMEKLSNDEKDYLYKISKRAEFADKISIPTPSKDQQEKDIHEFEVCKGEIMAGNDSKELIKKFKLLIIKLSKNGTIPKREASEVMTELLELGY